MVTQWRFFFFTVQLAAAHVVVSFQKMMLSNKQKFKVHKIIILTKSDQNWYRFAHIYVTYGIISLCPCIWQAACPWPSSRRGVTQKTSPDTARCTQAAGLTIKGPPLPQNPPWQSVNVMCLSQYQKSWVFFVCLFFSTVPVHPAVFNPVHQASI